MCSRTERGQATVEAAFLIPVIFTVMLMLIEPGILLYDRMVMDGAAAEACRLLATKSTAEGFGEDEYTEVVERHLGAIPQQELFHVHEGGCTYEVKLQGDADSREVSVEITNEVRLLPLFDVAGSLTGLATDGRYRFSVRQSAQTKPSWY